MVFEVTSNKAELVGLTAASFFAWLFLQSPSTERYQFIWTNWYICIVAAFDLLFSTKLKTFVFLFLFRYARLFINLAAFIRYKPDAIPDFPTLIAKDVTVIVPTVEPYGEDFEECIRSIHLNRPGKVIVVTAGPGNYDRAVGNISIYSNVLIKNCQFQNKRRQVNEALSEV